MKKIITIVLTGILFISAVTLGINSVYRVSEVVPEINFVSEDAKIESEELRARLSAVYDKRSIFEVKKEDAESVFNEFPYFRLTGFKKEYPNKIVVEVTEDAEVFAVANATGGYYILALDGTILSVRESLLNRSDGAPNIIIEGVECSGEKGGICTSEKIIEILPFLKEFSSQLGGLRANITKIEYKLFGASIDQYNFTMREGLTIMLQKPGEFVNEKAKMVAEEYLALEDIKLLGGYLFVTNNEEKVINPQYYPEFPFNG